MEDKNKMEFNDRLAQTLDSIDQKVLSFNQIEAAKCADLYGEIDRYAHQRQLFNTALALPIVRGILAGVLRSRVDFDKDGSLRLTYYEHCLSATKMLMELHLALPYEQEDILLASTLCHDLIENIPFPDHGRELMTQYHLDPQVYDIVCLITRPHPFYEHLKKDFYAGVQGNMLAVLVALADRGNLMEQVYGLSISNALEYVRDIRKYTLPMCVYVKEHYPEIHMQINILMEKIRCLIDVTDIISSRYQKRENALATEALSLMEENARIRGMIHQLKKENENIS